MTRVTATFTEPLLHTHTAALPTFATSSPIKVSDHGAQHDSFRSRSCLLLFRQVSVADSEVAEGLMSEVSFDMHQFAGPVKLIWLGQLIGLGIVWASLGLPTLQPCFRTFPADRFGASGAGLQAASGPIIGLISAICSQLHARYAWSGSHSKFP